MAVETSVGIQPGSQSSPSLYIQGLNQTGIFYDSVRSRFVFVVGGVPIGSVGLEGFVSDSLPLSFVAIGEYANNLSTAVSTIGDASLTLVIDKPITLSSNTTVPENIELQFTRAGSIAVPNGVTLTINGTPRAGLWQIFSLSGSGLVTFVGPAVEVCPEWWGAVGDGDTNDEVGVQSAVDSLPSTGGVVRLSGVYGLDTAGLEIVDLSNVVLRGSGWHSGFKILDESVLTNGPFSQVSISISGATQLSLENFLIDGNSVDSVTVHLDSCTDCTVAGLKVINFYRIGGIVGTSNTRNIYRDNLVSDSAVGSLALGIYLGNENVGYREIEASVTGNRVHDTTATGISCLSKGGVVSHNKVFNSGQSGIIVSAHEAEIGSAVVISNNYVRGCPGQGIQADCVDADDSAQNVVVSGNILEENDNSGIYVVRAQGWVVSGNICRNNNFDGSGSGHGIILSTCKRVLVIGNLCEDTRSGGSRTQSTGIQLQTTENEALDVEDVLIIGNVCRNNLGNGIQVVNSGSGTIDTAIVFGNLCVDNGDRGVSVLDTVAGAIANVTVFGNTALGNFTEDIRLDPPDAIFAFNNIATQTSVNPEFDNGDTTPSVKGRKIFYVSNPSPTTITNFDDGVDGQEIIVITYGNNNTTLANGSLMLSGGVDYTNVPADTAISFVYDGFFWYETGRSED